MYKHLLLPTDGSETSLSAVRQGVALAQSLGAEVTVMTVIERFPSGITDSAHVPEETVRQDSAREAALVRLEAAEKLAQQAGVRCHRILSSEHPIHQGILEAAHTAGADLIVMGTHGMGAVERLLVGSQTQRVLAHTKLPVLALH